VQYLHAELEGAVRLPLDEAKRPSRVGGALGHARARLVALEKLDEALDLLRRDDAGPAWLERVSSERDVLRLAAPRR
jgi:hypothetical protein